MKMSTNSATTTMSTDNGISLVEANERAGEGDGGDDQLTINSLSSSLSSSTAATDTEGESGVDGAEGGRKAKKRRADGSFSRGSSGKEIEELDGEETAPEEDAALEAEAPPYAEKTRDRAIGRLITFSCILFTVPLTLMYITYRFLFIGHYQLAHDRAILYAGIFAAATVYLILAVFAWIAYRSRDETEFAQQVTIAEGDGDKKTD